MDQDEDEILSAALLLTPSEMWAEFHERCYAAAESHSNPLTDPGLIEASAALCRMLDRKQ